MLPCKVHDEIKVVATTSPTPGTLVSNCFFFCQSSLNAIALIAFELGLRFFTDYLAGNVYFKVNYPEHNLMRALVQFQLTASIEFQEKLLRQIISRD